MQPARTPTLRRIWLVSCNSAAHEADDHTHRTPAIIGLDPEYRWAVVGEPRREYLWILSRTPTMSVDDYDRAIAIAKANGFDVTLLQRTSHAG